MANKNVSLSNLRKQRPGNVDAIAATRDRMLAASRAYQLKELRLANQLTQQEMADLLGVDQSRISRIESGQLDRTEVGTLAAFVEALGGVLEISVRIGTRTHALTSATSETPTSRSTGKRRASRTSTTHR